MPVLESTEKIAPKSVLRHRPIGESVPLKGKTPLMTSQPVVQRASRPHPSDVAEDIAEWQRSAAQAPLANRHAKTRRSTGSKTIPRTLRPKTSRRLYNAHPLLYLGVGMLAMLVLWITLSAVFSWCATTLDDLRYGRPRTFQTDAWVGHNEQTGVKSHFVALNLNRHIEIIEIPGGDASHTRIYVGPQLYSAGDELVPVTLNFVDANGDHKPDMLVNFQGSRIVFINDQGGFRPLQPPERHQVEQFLQHWGQ